MKKIIFSAFILLPVLSAFAADSSCEKMKKMSPELNTDFWENKAITIHYSVAQAAPVADFLNYESLQDLYKAKDCQRGMKKRFFSVAGINGKDFEAIVSTEDSCDGGNTYGLLRDVRTNKVIGLIGDSALTCL